MSKHEWWTLAILAVVAALALAAVVSAFTWIIYNRIASRRRRTNLEVKFCLNKQYEVLAVCDTSPFLICVAANLVQQQCLASPRGYYYFLSFLPNCLFCFLAHCLSRAYKFIRTVL